MHMTSSLNSLAVVAAPLVVVVVVAHEKAGARYAVPCLYRSLPCPGPDACPPSLTTLPHNRMSVMPFQCPLKTCTMGRYCLIPIPISLSDPIAFFITTVGASYFSFSPPFSQPILKVRKLALNKQVVCKTCDGSGSKKKGKTSTCGDCRGQVPIMIP